MQVAKSFMHLAGIKAYRTRDRRRGVLMIFNYTEFANGVEEPRRGADVDCVKLKYLFDEMGFKVSSYPNYTKKVRPGSRIFF